jgi:hypothetical protein
MLSNCIFYFLGAEPSIDTKKPEPSLHSKKWKSTKKDKVPRKKKRSSKENQAALCSVKKEPAEVIEINSESDSDPDHPVIMPVRRMQPRIATGECNLLLHTSNNAQFTVEELPQATSSHLPSLPPDDIDLGLDNTQAPSRRSSTPLSEPANTGIGQSSTIIQLPVTIGFSVAPASPLGASGEAEQSDGHGKNHRLGLMHPAVRRASGSIIHCMFISLIFGFIRRYYS